jgi:hypothetical protein
VFERCLLFLATFIYYYRQSGHLRLFSVNKRAIVSRVVVYMKLSFPFEGHILCFLFVFQLHFKIRLDLCILSVEYRVQGFFALSARGEVRCYSLRKGVFSSGVMGCGHARRCSRPPETEHTAISSRR